MAKRQRPHGTGCLFKRSERSPWIARWFDHTGKRKEKSTGTTDRAAAERILAKRIGDTALRKDGVIDARGDKHVQADRLPLADHVEAWIAALLAKGVTKRQTASVRSRVDAILNTTHAERISELSASAVQVCIGDMHDGGTSLQTCQHYLRAIKQFSRWLKRDGRVRDDALAHLTGYNAATDRRYERRALDAEELAQLIAAAEDGPPWRWSLSGTDRGMLYRVASGTGFRASELASLTPAGFDLDADQPTVMLRAATSKPRREDLQPIRTDLAELLRKWLADKPAEAPAWPGHWYDQGAEMVRSDLRRAKARWIREGASRAERRKRLDSDFLNAVDSSGQIVDFHALRTTYITMLVKGGASVKVAQQLARHSDPKLTLNVYTKLGSHDLASGLAGLPASPQQQPARKRKRATGS